MDVDELSALARQFGDQNMFDEAIHLYEMACRLRPGSVALELSLSRTRERKRIAEESRFAAVRQQARSERGRDEVDCTQYVGLAQYYTVKDQTAKAIELLEIAKLRSPNNYRAYEILGRLYFSEGEWNAAHADIQKARQLNPFDRGLAEISGRIEFELKQYERSLREFIDAFLLAPDKRGEGVEPVRRMINTLKRIVGIDNATLHNLIRERLDELALYAERLEFRKENLFKVESRTVLQEILKKVTRDAETRENLISLSSELRRLTVFQHLRDEQVFQLSRFARVESAGEGDYLFRENDRSMDFYVIKDGVFEIRKETPAGPQIFAAIGVDNIIGEMNFLDRTYRSTDAMAVQPSSLYTFSFSALDQITDVDKELAVGLHWAFWRSLTEKLRDANEQLKMFFPQAGYGDAARRTPRSLETQEVQVEPATKMDLFEERGLSAAEMKLLATFSNEERFRAGSRIFTEGDGGDKLYIVMDGRVRISKMIPGVGEEALAILGRADFFGEMSLIDSQPRSADATAHEADATVLSIDAAALHEVLSLDPHASLQFLNVLCRMISRRLREINDKIVQWKYMSGGF